MKKVILTVSFCICNFVVFGQEKITTESGAKSDLLYKEGKVGIGAESKFEADLHISKDHPTIRLGSRKAAENFTGSIGSIDFAKHYDLGVVSRISSNTKWGNGEWYSADLRFSTAKNSVLKDRMVIDSEGNIGIGSSLPQSKLHINSNTTNSELLRLDNNGLRYTTFNNYSNGSDNVGLEIKKHSNEGQFKFSNLNRDLLNITFKGELGVGISSPRAKLHIVQEGDAKGSEWSSEHPIQIWGDDQDLQIGVDTENRVSYFQSVDHNTVTSNIVLNPRGGNVGIGTVSPDARLTVKGKIHAQEVKVTASAGTVPDYVFKEDYKMMPLADVEKYIKEYSHLPEVKSATQIEEEGLHLAEMNLILLKKIEELTLHTIEQEKRLNQQDHLKDKVDRQEKLIETLLERITKLENK
ncbi:tail fiber protein [Flammeovirga sp. SJP92]|uniref:tail fiber protein n=1 Tax=Flammeovirga sp. SJP92 TaxID=1775430 RepID=UPI0007890F7C|nr:tail fiber protein [Flammeovirga sp. SJP92]KXX71232.1 hypothetical protein AVL50_09250 [Flammeovirga sp. SJP92]